jgi:WD40 repeat protein
MDSDASFDVESYTPGEYENEYYPSSYSDYREKLEARRRLERRDSRPHRTYSVNHQTVATLDVRPVIVAGVSDGAVFIRHLVSTETCYNRVPRYRGGVSAAAVGRLNTSSVIVLAGADGIIRLLDLHSNSLLGELVRGHRSRISAVTVGALNGHPVIVSGGEGGTVQLWEVTAEPRRGPVLRGHEGEVRSIVMGFLDRSAVIISGAEDGTVRVWDGNGKALSSIGIGSEIHGLASAGGGNVVVATTRGLLLLEFDVHATARSQQVPS